MEAVEFRNLIGEYTRLCGWADQATVDVDRDIAELRNKIIQEWWRQANEIEDLQGKVSKLTEENQENRLELSAIRTFGTPKIRQALKERDEAIHLLLAALEKYSNRDNWNVCAEQPGVYKWVGEGQHPADIAAKALKHLNSL